MNDLRVMDERLRAPFERTVAATLALDIERQAEAGPSGIRAYVSPKTQNCWISYCYGWVREGSATQSLEYLHDPGSEREIIDFVVKEIFVNTDPEMRREHSDLLYEAWRGHKYGRFQPYPKYRSTTETKLF